MRIIPKESEDSQTVAAGDEAPSSESAPLPGTFIERLLAAQDQVLIQLEDLDRKILDVIAAQTAGSAAEIAGRDGKHRQPGNEPAPAIDAA